MRESNTYRAARRNEILRPEDKTRKTEWIGFKTKYFDPPPVRPNRSKRWEKK